VSDIGHFKTSVCREVDYSGKGPPIEVEIEVEGVVYCDSADWGLEARDLEARIIERELEDDEITALDLECDFIEAFSESDPVPPKIGERYRGPDGAIWTVVSVAMTWHEAERYVLIERENARWFFRGPRKIQRLVQTADFLGGAGCDDDEDSDRNGYLRMFEPVIDPKEYEGDTIKPMGYVDKGSSVWD